VGAPPSPAVGGRFQGAAAGPLEGAPEGRICPAPPLPLLRSGWLCQELEGGRPGRWAVVGTDEKIACSYYPTLNRKRRPFLADLLD